MAYCNRIPLGYSVLDIYEGLVELSSRSPIPSIDKIRKYIRENNLQERKIKTIIVPECNLEKLIEVMQIPVKKNELISVMEKFK